MLTRILKLDLDEVILFIFIFKFIFILKLISFSWSKNKKVLIYNISVECCNIEIDLIKEIYIQTT